MEAIDQRPRDYDLEHAALLTSALRQTGSVSGVTDW
jgi:hypothetical protein